jgi:hypothetical protein
MMEKVNGFYEIVKLYKGGLSLDMPAFDVSVNNRKVVIPWDVKKVRVPRVFALGIYTDGTLQRMYEEGYFKVEPAAEFQKEVAEIFAPVENKPNIVEESVILDYLLKGNRAAVRKLIEQNDVNKENVILLARENIDRISTSMVRDLEKILSVELIIENENIDEQ